MLCKNCYVWYACFFLSEKILSNRLYREELGVRAETEPYSSLSINQRDFSFETALLAQCNCLRQHCWHSAIV